jgi:eukaryotic-like serine/threonine-protein kinase
MIGETVGPYNIVSELGRGGMGVVYLAEHRHLGRPAAIKFLLRELSESAELLNRFFTEARAASLIEHDGIVRVFDCDVHPSGNAYIVMEYLDGQTLRRYLHGRGPLPVPEAAAIMLRVADALTAAHAKGIVHRDIKPDNIFVLARPPGAIKIVDFGIAKLSPAAQKIPSATMSGIMLGTPLYMSPEQAKGAGNVDDRTDVYSLGCILYEMLNGRPPFLQRSAAELMMAHMAQTPPPLDGSFPAPLRMLVKGMLAKSPEERPALREEVIPILESATSGRLSSFPAAATTPQRGWPPPTHTMPALRAESHSPTTTMGADSSGEPPRGRGGLFLGLVLLSGLIAGGVAFWRAQNPPVVSISDSNGAVTPPPPPITVPTEPPPPAATASSEKAAATEPASEPIAEVAPPAALANESPRSPPRPRPIIRVRPAARAASQRKTARPQRQAMIAVEEPIIRVALTTDPPGSRVCVPGQPGRVGVTNAVLELTPEARQTLLIYHPGFHIERVTITGDKDVRRAVKLRPLDNDDLQAPPPCR